MLVNISYYQPYPLCPENYTTKREPLYPYMPKDKIRYFLIGRKCVFSTHWLLIRISQIRDLYGLLNDSVYYQIGNLLIRHAEYFL